MCLHRHMAPSNRRRWYTLCRRALRCSRDRTGLRYGLPDTNIRRGDFAQCTARRVRTTARNTPAGKHGSVGCRFVCRRSPRCSDRWRTRMHVEGHLGSQAGNGSWPCAQLPRNLRLFRMGYRACMDLDSNR